MSNKERLTKRLLKAKRELEAGGHATSVAAICDRAKFPRSTLYRKYPELASQLSARSSRGLASRAQKVSALEEEVKRLRSHVAILARTCIELKMRLDEALQRAGTIS